MGLVTLVMTDGLIGWELKWRDLRSAALLSMAGVLGAVVSAVQRLARDPVQGTIPARLGSITVILTRVFVGAAAGQTVFFGVLARQSPAVGAGTQSALLLASSAGFAERLATMTA